MLMFNDFFIFLAWKWKKILFGNNRALGMIANNVDDTSTYQVPSTYRSTTKFSRSVIRDVTILELLDSDDLRR